VKLVDQLHDRGPHVLDLLLFRRFLFLRHVVALGKTCRTNAGTGLGRRSTPRLSGAVRGREPR
jgi:hypothetical protein